jgi:hypothetical protein
MLLRKNSVRALAILGPRGGDLPTHLLADCPGQEPADGMCLPPRRLHDLFEVGAVLPPQEFQNSLSLGALSRAFALRPLGGLGPRRFGRFLGGGREERPGPEPDQGKGNFPPPFRVVLTSLDEDPAPGAQPR